MGERLAMSQRRILVLPGMGATSAMYQGAWRDALDNATFVDWPRLRHGEIASLEAVADCLIDRYAVTADDLLVGSSLGGIVAQVMAARCGSRELVLVGSARSRHEIQPALLTLAAAADMAPLGVIQFLAGKTPVLASAMFADVDGRFIREMAKALPQWDGVSLPNCQVYRIHGTYDHVIPCPADAQLVLPAGHLLAMTHPTACVAFVQQICASQETPS